MDTKPVLPFAALGTFAIHELGVDAKKAASSSQIFPLRDALPDDADLINFASGLTPIDETSADGVRCAPIEDSIRGEKILRQPTQHELWLRAVRLARAQSGKPLQLQESDPRKRAAQVQTEIFRDVKHDPMLVKQPALIVIRDGNMVYRLNFVDGTLTAHPANLPSTISRVLRESEIAKLQSHLLDAIMTVPQTSPHERFLDVLEGKPLLPNDLNIGQRQVLSQIVHGLPMLYKQSLQCRLSVTRGAGNPDDKGYGQGAILGMQIRIKNLIVAITVPPLASSPAEVSLTITRLIPQRDEFGCEFIVAMPAQVSAAESRLIREKVASYQECDDSDYVRLAMIRARLFTDLT